MDTREKIISLPEIPAVIAEGEWIVVVGRFDPMTAFEAERLAELGQTRRVLAVVLEEDGALLAASARAVLVAALRDVSAVTIGGPESWWTAIPEGAAVQIVEDHQGDAARRNTFVEMVLRQQQIK